VEELAQFLADCEFTTPLYFWIAGALVLLLILLPWFGRERGLTIDLQYWRRKVSFKSKRVWLLLIPVVIVSIIMVGVLSDPQVTTRPITYVYGYPVMIVFDVSGSMSVGSAEASYKQGLEAFDDLVARRGDINFGLMLFSTENYVARYFINKNELFIDTLENKEEITYISKGTRIAEALAKAYLFFTENIKGEDKAIVLISDLDVNSTELSSVIEEMTRISLADINLYIIATGKGKQNAADIPQMPGLKIVDANDKYGIDQIYGEISAMQISPISEEEGLLKKSLIPFLILPALGVIFLCLILSETRFQKIP
jgi:hypothetical protein